MSIVNEVVILHSMNPAVRGVTQGLYNELLTQSTTLLRFSVGAVASAHARGVSFAEEEQFDRLLDAVGLFVRPFFHCIFIR
jgi:hypothetical protein